MRTIDEIAQWVINNRYAKSEDDGMDSFLEMYYFIVDEINDKTKELQDQLAESEKLKNMYDRTAKALEMSNDALKEQLAAKEKEIDVCQKLYKTITEYFNSDSFINKQQVINVLDEYDLINTPK